MSEPVTTKAPGRRRMYLLVRMLCEGGLMIALALVLGLLKVFELPQGCLLYTSPSPRDA